MTNLNLTSGVTDMQAVQPTAAPPVASAATAQALNKEIADKLNTRAKNSIEHKKSFLNDWKRNVDIRLGQPVPLYTEGLDIDADLQSSINPDWSLTKTKTANLFSQVPTIRGTHVSDTFAPAIAPFLKQLNYELGPKRANTAVAMNECLNDVVNASGIAAAIVTYQARFDTVQLPLNDPMLPAPAAAPSQVPTTPLPGDPNAALAADGSAVPGPANPMADVARPLSDMFCIDRISPKDLLWPSEFTGSDFNNADYMGRRGTCTKAVAQVDFKLNRDQLAQVVESAVSDGSPDLRSRQENKLPKEDLDQVSFSEIFYWRYRMDPNEKNFKAIWRLVFVDGLTDPVIHEPYKGQRYSPMTRKYVGVCKLPIQVMTLTYITDNPVPPSDSQAGRPQVNDMRRSRSQMFQNRQRSIPIRWFDVNRIDQDLQGNLMRGIVQGMLPTNGPGDRAIGEVARASYPSENLEFDQAVKMDLMESWQVGPNQLGTTQPGRHTAGEADIVQQNFSTRIGQERGFVAQFFVNLAEILAGLLVLYSDFSVLTPQEKSDMMQAWDQKAILHDLVLNIVPDSTVLLDADQQIAKLMKVLNMTVQSGFVNPEPIIAQILELSGLDPKAIMTKPQPKSPEMKLSMTFAGKEDMTNPLVIAMLMKMGEFPDPQTIEQAKQVLDNLPNPGMPAPPGMPPGPPPPGGPGPVPNGQQPPAHPNWHMAPKVATRSREMGGA